jgi:nitrite reductase/ring-hydroxylating ferredoxin subunit
VVRWHRVPLSTLETAGRAVVVAGGREIVLFRVDGDVHALENACPHAGNPLVEGEIVGGTLTCAYHLWRFDLETGACLAGEEAARRYATVVREGEVWIDLGP